MTPMLIAGPKVNKKPKKNTINRNRGSHMRGILTENIRALILFMY